MSITITSANISDIEWDCSGTCAEVYEVTLEVNLDDLSCSLDLGEIAQLVHERDLASFLTALAVEHGEARVRAASLDADLLPQEEEEAGGTLAALKEVFEDQYLAPEVAEARAFGILQKHYQSNLVLCEFSELHRLQELERSVKAALALVTPDNL